MYVKQLLLNGLLISLLSPPWNFSPIFWKDSCYVFFHSMLTMQIFLRSGWPTLPQMG